MPPELILFCVSLLLAFALTPLVRLMAIRYGFVAPPRKDRWHTVPTALFGGIGIFFAYSLPLLFFIPSGSTLPILLLGGTLVFLIGLVDDVIHLQPYSKLIGQIVAACLVIANGVVLGPSDISILNILLTLVWIVGITNAFNLLDNMDGLSAGTGCIAALCLFLSGVITDNTVTTLAAAGLVGAMLGFLWFNFHPAKIFMGDSGSLFLGYTLATLAITGTGEYAPNLFFAMLVPVLVLAVPIFDTTFVAILRYFNGKAISEGGRDHTSHRLVAFGLSEKTTVLLFYLMSMICGGVALLGLEYSMVYPSILAILIVITLWYFGIFLSGLISYGEKAKDMISSSQGFGLDLFLMHKRRIGEIIVDCILICVSFAIAFVIRFDGLPETYISSIAQAIPILLPLKLGAFFYFGMYRGLWRYIGMQDVLNIFKAVSLSSLLAVVVMTMAFRFEGYPRSVFVIDWMVLLLSVSGVRVLIRFIEEYLGTLAEPKGKRLLIVGAGDAGEIALREIKNNTQLGYLPIGFIDDDQQKQGRSIHGVPILGARAMLPTLVQENNIEEILIAIPSASLSTLKKVLRDCKATGVAVQIMPKTMALVEPTLAR